MIEALLTLFLATAPVEHSRSRLIASGQKEIDASLAVDELLDDLAADLGRLGRSISPLLVDRVQVSDNLHPDFAGLLRARVERALHESGQLNPVRCLECSTVRGKAGGLTSREELSRLTTSYGVRAVLSVALVLRREPDSLALEAEVIQAPDASVLFAERYTLDAGSGMLYRGVDSQKTREERLADLEDRLQGRPHYGHGAYFGAMWVPSEEEQGTILGPYGSYRLYEKFGAARQHRVGLSVGGFLHSERLAGALLGLVILTRLTEENLYRPSFFAGGSVGWFLAGSAGNTPMASAHAELQLGERLVIQASLSWIHPFEFAKKRPLVGGLTPQAGMGFVW